MMKFQKLSTHFPALILYCSLGLSATVQAGELVIAYGHKSGRTSTTEALAATAKNEALSTLPVPQMKQRSEWTVRKNTFCFYGTCDTWIDVAASFEDPAQRAPWFANVTGGYGSVDSIGDQAAYTEAQKNSRTQAEHFCRGKAQETDDWTLTKQLVSADYYHWYATNRFRCLE